MSARASKRLLLAAAAAVLLCGAWLSARAAPLVADLSEHLIKITTSFTGADVLLFGATDGPGDVVVVVRGPDVPLAVRRKQRVAGIWVNRSEVVFPSAPSFYAVAASTPLSRLLEEEVLQRHQIGPWALRLTPNERVDTTVLAEYRAALRRIRDAQGLFQLETKRVQFLGQQLFRVDINFPSNVPTGMYMVEVFLIRDGDVVTAQTTPLKVEKHGFDAEVWEFAHRYAPWYGLAAVALAMAAGWLAGTIFRRS